MSVPRHRLAWSVACGLGLAALYTITPLTIVVIVVAAVVLPWFGRGLAACERRWLTAVVAVALVVRVAAIGGLFVRNLPNHDDLFTGATSGDEAYTMSRALRTREILRGSAPSLYDFFVTYDEYGSSSYVTAATMLQVIAGPTPYSLRLLNAVLFTIGALLLFRLSHAAFGFTAALAGLAAVLFWPSLFVWSISLLKESLYFLLGAAILTAAVTALQARRWRIRGAALAGAALAAVLIQGLRPGALGLAGAGFVTGLALFFVSRSRRIAVALVAAALLVVAFGMSQPAVSARVISALEGTAKTHTGHVFTVGHDYKLLDAGFYVNPQAPAASTLTLTGAQAARYVMRAASSFVTTPAPWQLQSVRELAYLPEQIAWYILVLLLPIGIVAGCRRDRLVTCMLVGYVAPTAIALALTNGNVGTLLRLRGLVVPFLAWVSAVGFLATINRVARKDTMAWIDDEGRLFGRVNLFDAAIAGFVVVLVPIAYGTFLLFRAPTPHISSVTRAPIGLEERRVAGGNRLTAKLKVRGSGLRPMLHASIDGTPALGFVFENPNSADVLVGDVPPGPHDLILFDGVQEVARLAAAVTIESAAPRRIAAVGTLVEMDTGIADALTPAADTGTPNAIVKLGPVREQAGGLRQRAAEILLACDPAPNGEACSVGGVLIAMPWPTVRVSGPSGATLAFALSEILPVSPPVTAIARIRVTGPPEILQMLRTGDRDDSLDDRAAVLTDIVRRGSSVDATLRLGVDLSGDDMRYRGRPIKAGAPFTLTTERYMAAGSVLDVQIGRAGGAR
ncbi:MAG: hypothetical protein JWL71_165 [Acidobacteria bacterium]|nr:hypothetical protein [Acidobacteriota bacterium]